VVLTVRSSRSSSSVSLTARSPRLRPVDERLLTRLSARCQRHWKTAGWNGKNLPRMIKLLDLDSVEIDEDGVDYDALEAQVTELKRDFPEFFKRTRMKDAAKEVADTGVAGGGREAGSCLDRGIGLEDEDAPPASGRRQFFVNRVHTQVCRVRHL
jgi:hypothetical protein